MSKSSIIVYLESSPPFLLELIYSCIFSIILIVFIFTVRERIQSLTFVVDTAKHLQKNSFTAKRSKKLQGSNGGVIYSSSDKRKIPQEKVHNRNCTTDDSSCSVATSETTVTRRWSKNLKDSIEEFGILSRRIVRPGTLKRLRRGNSHKISRKMNNNFSTTGSPYHQMKQEHSETIDDMTTEEYESYVQSMTSIWNKLFNKPKLPLSSTHPITKKILPKVVDNSSLNLEFGDIGSKEWKHRIQKIWTQNDILKTDSTLAVRGSESEINIGLFTESELKIVEQPYKESLESVYSNYPGTNDIQDSDLCTMSGDDYKKNQFDIIYEEK